MEDLNIENKPISIHILPPEILQNIFSECIDSLPMRPRQNKAPWVLTQVCRSWRTIAVAHAALWSSISIAVNNPRWPVIWVYPDGFQTNGPCDPPIEVVASWLTRSAMYPLSIVLYLHFASVEEFLYPIPCRVLQLLRLHIGHTKALSICTWGVLSSEDDGAFDHQLNPLLLHGAVALEDLELWHMTGIVSSLSSIHFPRLYRFSWIGDSRKCLSLKIPWTQLRQLVLCHGDMVHYIDCLNVLRETPDLVSFKGSCLYNCQEPHCSYQGAEVPLAHLTTLDIKGVPGGLAPFFRFVTIPSLERLELAIYAPVGPERREVEILTPHLDSFFSTNRPPLKLLKVENLLIRPQQFLQLLHYVSQTLISLEIASLLKADHDVLSAFIVPKVVADCDAVLCPKLESLTLESSLMAPPLTLATMVESRCWDVESKHPFSRLRITILSMQAETYATDRARLEQLKSDGRLSELDWVEWGDADDW